MNALTVSEVREALSLPDDGRVVGLIRSGMLEAINVESRRNRPPEWRISHFALLDFMRRNSSREVAK